MHKGSCLCGKITFEIDQKISQITYCHCPMCRKAQGTAFGTNTAIDKSNFRFISGREYIKEFLSSSDKYRCFCKNCGSPIYSYFLSNPFILRLRIGCLDTIPEGKPNLHIYVEEKAPWYEINDGLPKYTTIPK